MNNHPNETRLLVYCIMIVSAGLTLVFVGAMPIPANVEISLGIVAIIVGLVISKIVPDRRKGK